MLIRAGKFQVSPPDSFRRGFTLIELMVVVVIIGILAAIVIPNYVSLRTRALEASTKSNMHSTQLVVEEFNTISDGIYPGDLDTRVVDVWPGVVGDIANKSIAAGARVPPFPPDALFRATTSFKNPFLPSANVIDNRLVPYPPVAIPPRGCVYFSSYQADGVTPGAPGQPAVSYKITGFGDKTPLPITLP